MKRPALTLCLVIGTFSPWISTHIVSAGQWPMYRADAARSGYTQEKLPADLAPKWVYKARHEPEPAWRGPDTRMPFDYAYHTVIADGHLYFGSSADGKVYALDAASGQECWTFYTGGPVRFAPVLWNKRVFAASDDGYLYCLATENGSVLWKQRGGPKDDMVLGNGRMISRWPARGGPVIFDNIVYFAAGIWPSEGIYIYALEAETGKVIWLNDSSGGIEMDQPHPTARAKSGVSAQGYLVATEQYLIVPTGRAVPAVFNRSNGKFLYFHLQEYGQQGGADVVAGDAHLLHSNSLWDILDGKLIVRGLPNICTLAVAPKEIVSATGSGIIGLKRSTLVVEKETVDRKGEKVAKRVLNDAAWTIKNHGLKQPSALIAAGERQIILGGTGENGHTVALIDRASGSVVWRAKVEGIPYGLAVANGRLYVSTSTGMIYCFDDRRAEQPAIIEVKGSISPYGENAVYATAAEEIIRQTGITDGYCMDLGCGQGRLSYELAKRTNLKIIAIDPDAEKVRIARTRLDAAGLYGPRVTVHQGDINRTSYPQYFANLIISGRSVSEGVDVVPARESGRLQRPYGGVVCVGQPGKMKKSVRGPLEGAGKWTHQYCDPANTCCSTDMLVKAPVGMFWFTDSTLEMPSRHGRGPAPLFWNGCLFVEGTHGLRAVDAYNGRILWEYRIENILKAYDQEHLNGAAVTGSNLCIAEGVLYVRNENLCLVLDAMTGKKIKDFQAPPAPDESIAKWGFIACQDGILYGSVLNEKHMVHWTSGKSDMSDILGESVLFFALDAVAGKLKWQYQPEYSIRNNTIAIAGGRAFLIDRPLAPMDLLSDKEFTARRRQAATKPDNPQTRTSEPEELKHPTGTLLALDGATGQVLWKNDKDIFGTLLAVGKKYDVLLMTYQYTRYRLHSEIGNRMQAFRASDGRELWAVNFERPKDYHSSSRPVINDHTIYLEPFAWDLVTGDRKFVSDSEKGDERPWQFARSYACGILTGSVEMLLFRSATLGYLDLLDGQGTRNYGGIRPGCWINALPVGGLILLPDATSRCVCSYLNKAWIALSPLEE